MITYKLVPVEPTEEMLAEGATVVLEGISRTTAGWIYGAMLAAASEVQVEVVGWQFYQDGKWWHGDDRIKDHRKNTEEAGFRVRDVYAAPQPVEQQPDVAQLVEALELFVSNPTPTSEDFDMAHTALATYRKQGGEA